MCTLEAHIAPAGTWMSGDTTIEIISEKNVQQKCCDQTQYHLKYSWMASL